MPCAMIAMAVDQWILLGFLGVMVLAVLGFAVVFFLAALLEKRTLCPLIREKDESVVGGESKAGKTRTEAIQAGFKDLGVFRDEEGVMKGHVVLLLSPDSHILVMVFHGNKLTFRYRLLSRLADDRMLFTSEVSGEPDLTGRRTTAFCQGPVRDLEAHHRRSLSGSAVIPFNPVNVPRELLDDERRRVNALVSQGLAQWAGHDFKTWRYTFTGAVKVTVVGISEMGSTIRQAARAGQKSGNS